MSAGRAGAIILAAGRSERMGGRDKALAPLAGLPLLAHSLRAFAACPAVTEIVLVSGAGNHAALVALAAAHGGGRQVRVVPGGARRQDSTAAGLAALSDVDLVTVHDASRPLVTPALIERGLALAAQHGAAIPVGPLADTIKQVSPPAANGAHPVAHTIDRTIDRTALRAAQTPQAFRRALLQRAHAAARGDVTDDAMLVEALGEPVWTYPANGANLKVTTPDDLIVAEALLRTRPAAGREGEPLEARIGIGSDSHRFDPARPLILGGVQIPESPGLAGHSDADVLTHAIIDALLGAAALGDIGHHFPPSDPQWAGADSQDLLRRTVARLAQRGYRVGNIDATVVAESPRLQPHLAAMCERLAASLAVAPAAINVKATGAEGMGALGRAEGLHAQAIARIVPRGQPEEG